MSDAPVPRPGDDLPASPWALWLALTWAALVLLTAVATLAGLEDLRLVLDLARHLAPAGG